MIELESFVMSKGFSLPEAPTPVGAYCAAIKSGKLGIDLIANEGYKAGHARSVVGCNSLPQDAAIEITSIIELE